MAPKASIPYRLAEKTMFFRFRKALNPDKENTRDVDSISRLCDRYSIPFASNVATAEVRVQGLRRGDLDWRDIVNPKKNK